MESDYPDPSTTTTVDPDCSVTRTRIKPITSLAQWPLAAGEAQYPRPRAAAAISVAEQRWNIDGGRLCEVG